MLKTLAKKPYWKTCIFLCLVMPPLLQQCGSVDGPDDQRTLGSQNADPQLSPIMCTSSVSEEGVILHCPGTDPVLVRHGRDGQDCTAKPVDKGIQIQCGEDDPTILLHGQPGQSAAACQTQQQVGGVSIQCPGLDPVFVADGMDGADGLTCIASEQELGVLLSCPNQEPVVIANGKNGTSCRTDETESGTYITCDDGSQALLRHGADGEAGLGCTATQTSAGAVIQCGELAPVLVRHGEDGVEGQSCSAHQHDWGAEIRCGDEDPVLVHNGATGRDGAHGDDCQVLPVPEGALIRCGTEAEAVTVLHGRDGMDGEDFSGIGIDEIIDPCGDGDGYDERILKLSDGTLLAYFESGSQRFLTTLDPETDHGWYQTTDSQKCKFQLLKNGEIRW